MICNDQSNHTKNTGNLVVELDMLCKSPNLMRVLNALGPPTQDPRCSIRNDKIDIYTLHSRIFNEKKNAHPRPVSNFMREKIDCLLNLNICLFAKKILTCHHFSLYLDNGTSDFAKKSY